MTKDQLRASQPALAAWADDIREIFECAKVSHLHVGEFEYGEKLTGVFVNARDIHLAEGSNKRTT